VVALGDPDNLHQPQTPQQLPVRHGAVTVRVNLPEPREKVPEFGGGDVRLELLDHLTQLEDLELATSVQIASLKNFFRVSAVLPHEISQL